MYFTIFTHLCLLKGDENEFQITMACVANLTPTVYPPLITIKLSEEITCW